MKLKVRVLLLVLFVAVIGFIPNKVQADYEYENLTYTINSSTNTVTITGITDKKVEEIEIPSEIGKRRVQDIGANAFCECTNLTNITISNSVTNIGNCAFYDCENLKNIIIPNSVICIGASAFSGCENLIYVEIPNSVIRIEETSFSRCSKLTSISIPNSVEYIGDGAFAKCNNLEEINIDNSNNKYLSDNGILFTKDKTRLVYYPMKKIEANYSIPEGVTKIGGRAFEGNSYLESVIVPDSVTSIGSYAFRDCTNITSIEIPNNVTKIEIGAFMKCSKIQSFKIPNSIKTIEENTFEGCTNLINIEFSDSVVHILDCAFLGCIKLSDVKLTNNIKSICYNAFGNCTNLTKLEIPESMENIEYYVFNNCKNLEYIKMPKGNISIGQNAFKGCTSLILGVKKGSDAETYAQNYNIQYRHYELEDCTIEEIQNQIYTGKEIKPDIIVKDEENHLVEDTDYTLEYKSNIEIGTGKVIITGLGNYTGEITKEFEIDYEEELKEALKIMNSIPETIHVSLTASEQIDKIYQEDAEYIDSSYIEDEIYLPEGYDIRLVFEDWAGIQGVWVWIYHNGEKFPYSSYRKILGREYEYIGYKIEYKDTVNRNQNTNEQVEKFINKLYNYEDKYSDFEYSEDLTNGIPNNVMKRANEQIINDIKNKSTIDNLEVKIIHIENDLDSQDDECKGLYYRLALLVDNIYYSSVQGLQKFVKVDKTDVNTLKVTGITDKTYTGEEIKQNIIVKDGNETLTENTDYTVGYKNNKNVGTATVTITGIGEYTETKELTFKINKATYDMSKVKFENLTVTYDGKSHKITATGLPTGVNVTYKNNDKTNVGTYTVTAVFTGDTTNYNTTSDMTATLKINAKNISSTSISSIGNQTYTGKEIKPTVVVKDGNITLKNGTDYTVSYTNHKNTGKATITVTGKGNYTGTKTTTYRIIPSQVINLKAKLQKEKHITLQWSKNGGNVTGYKVYQYNSKTKKWDYVGKTSNTNYTIKKLKAGTTYKFRVRAYKTIDGTQYFGSYSSKLNTSTTPYATKLKTLSTKNKKVTAKWNKVSGATGYEIYMSTKKNNGYSKIKTIKSGNVISYTKGSLKKNKIYYFKIRTYRTVNGKKIYSSYSNIKKIKVK